MRVELAFQIFQLHLFLFGFYLFVLGLDFVPSESHLQGDAQAGGKNPAGLKDAIAKVLQEVEEKQNIQQRILAIQMDSLYINNQTLNRKLNNLVRELESETNHRISNRYRELAVERENSYSIISKLAIFITLISSTTSNL